MTSMLLSVIMHASILATGADATPAAADTYAEAHRTTTRTGKPMVVMVSTEWCAPCQMMKKTVMPRVREHGLLRKVAFAMVNPDHDRDLAEKLTGGGPIPQLVMFRRTAKGWTRKNLVGGQSVETVEEFINEGLADDKAEHKTTAGAGEKADKPSSRSQRAKVTDEGGAKENDKTQHG